MALYARYGERQNELRRAFFLCISFLTAAGIGVITLILAVAGVVGISTPLQIGIGVAVGCDAMAILLLRRGLMEISAAVAIGGLFAILLMLVVATMVGTTVQLYRYAGTFFVVIIVAGLWSRRWWHIAALSVFEIVAIWRIAGGYQHISTTDELAVIMMLLFGGVAIAISVERNRRDQAVLAGLSSGLKQTNTELLNVAYLDPLTGMPNRIAFTRDLRPADQAVAIINVGDMTRLATIFELPQIEEILLTLARRIAGLAVRLAGFLEVYRTGDHEFSIVASLEDGDRRAFEEQIDVILESLRQPLVVEGQPVYLQSTAGYATVSDAEEPQLAVRKAALALYEARRNGSWLQYYSETLEKGNARERLVADALISAIARRELHMVYQPIVDRRGDVVAHEALLRWNSDDLGAVSPVEFVPIATRAGLISRLSIRALDLVMSDLREWPVSWPEPREVHFNVSVSDLLTPSVRDTLTKSLFEFDIPINVTFELTESEFALNLDKVEHSVRVLKAMGYNIALDDFGTGYSSLSYLSRLPLRTLKIDRSFVSRVPGQRLDETIVQIAVRFGFNVVAEGVETEEQYELLDRLGCQFFQGFYFGVPAPLPATKAMDAR